MGRGTISLFLFLLWVTTPFLKADDELMSLSVDPLYHGLEEVLSKDFLDKNGFISFGEGGIASKAPIADRVFFNGVPALSRLATEGPRLRLSDVFHETHFARIPHGTKIKLGQKKVGEVFKTVWDYPVGTEAIHQMQFNDGHRSVFELRLIKKLKSGSWAYGIYTPDPQNPGRLYLNQYEDLRNETYEITLHHGRHAGVNLQIDLNHIRLASCRSCHFMNSNSKYQYDLLEKAGPALFVPDNPKGTEEWEKSYLYKFGESPFIKTIQD